MVQICNTFCNIHKRSIFSTPCVYLFHSIDRKNNNNLSSYRRLIYFCSREGQMISYSVFHYSFLTLLSMSPSFMVLYLFLPLNYIYMLLAVLRTNLRRFEQNSQNILLHCINFYFYKPASVVFVVLFCCYKEVTTNLQILHTFVGYNLHVSLRHCVCNCCLTESVS